MKQCQSVGRLAFYQATSICLLALATRTVSGVEQEALAAKPGSCDVFRQHVTGTASRSQTLLCDTQFDVGCARSSDRRSRGVWNQGSHCCGNATTWILAHPAALGSAGRKEPGQDGSPRGQSRRLYYVADGHARQRRRKLRDARSSEQPQHAFLRAEQLGGIQ